MKLQFRYIPPSPLNNLTYAVALGMFLAWNHFDGQRAWEGLTARLSPAAIYVGVGFGLYLTVFWTLGVGYMLLDRYQWPAFLYRYRLQTPPPGAVNPKTGSPPLASAVRVVLLNQFLGTLPVLVLVFWITQRRGHAFAAKVPDAWELLRDLTLMVLIEEVLFYGVHFALHQRPFFARFHHVHHRFRQSIGIATHYVHPVEHFLGNLLPIFAAVLLTNAHVVTTFVWVTLAVTNAIHTHSDYNFPWMSYAADHDWHHYRARGNYGTIGLLDRIFGTDREFRALAARAKAEKQQAA